MPEANRAAAARMDGIYRLQRHIYDATRKFYLLGRDRLIRLLPPDPAPDVLEIGCGTGRNLIKLAGRYPHGRLTGLDVSGEMLATAAAAVARAGLAGRVELVRIDGDAGSVAADGRSDRFDIVLCSYVLSMVPSWEALVAEAIDCAKPGGVLAIVDFGDQARAPAWRRFLLLRWLALFHVSPRPAIEAGLAEGPSGTRRLLHKDIGVGYAYIVMLRRDGPKAEAAARAEGAVEIGEHCFGTVE